MVYMMANGVKSIRMNVYNSIRNTEPMIRLLEGNPGRHAFWHTCISSY